MKKLFALFAVISIITGSLFANGNDWSPEKGKRVFYSKVRPTMCQNKQLTFKKIALSHTQKEWRTIIETNNFDNELQKFCSDFKASDLTKAQMKSLNDGVINYANDSYNIIVSCG